MNCLLNALAMSLWLMCVLSLKVIELLSCCGGRLCASPCIVFISMSSCCCCRPTPPACSCGGVRQPSFSREAPPGVSST